MLCPGLICRVVDYDLVVEFENTLMGKGGHESVHLQPAVAEPIQQLK